MECRSGRTCNQSASWSLSAAFHIGTGDLRRARRHQPRASLRGMPRWTRRLRRTSSAVTTSFVLRQASRSAGHGPCSARISRASGPSCWPDSPPQSSMPRSPRNPGPGRKRRTDLYSKFAGRRARRPAFEITRYFPLLVVGDRRSTFTLGPGGGDTEGSFRGVFWRRRCHSRAGGSDTGRRCSVGMATRPASRRAATMS